MTSRSVNGLDTGGECISVNKRKHAPGVNRICGGLARRILGSKWHLQNFYLITYCAHM